MFDCTQYITLTCDKKRINGVMIFSGNSARE